MAEAKTENKAEEKAKPAKKSRAAPKRKAPLPSNKFSKKEQQLFDKYSYDVKVEDLSLRNYINLKPLAFPSTFRRTSKKMFSKAGMNIVERLENAMMRGGTGKKIGGHVIRTKGRLQGKKIKVMHVIESAFDSVHRDTKENPLQLLIMALENSAPIEDTTRIRQGGTVSNIPVDISASRRLDIALRNIATASIIGAFGSKKTISEALANELILAAKNDINSYAIKRKNEIERMARSAK
ncbi:MAG: 30S ribosomal protein S7 [Candidatus Micrarchaeales archaeon]|jgi:ribosomal protein S7(archaeal)/S5(eukaryotic)|uniref:30S ribosomal protein S7 n=1 Tax=Candidatus Micrarchaeum acidiphilum ARMAN-2 TaxID=425595 RepID=C7DI39_MICA2|nr:MAG: ribosomal protein S7 [Candidatus Micrarchaeum acidiphilum ARMAN-2]MCW6160862.1 30S ribosomal protein S7 [Candidatus Micrarchaeales archaeon]